MGDGDTCWRHTPPHDTHELPPDDRRCTALTPRGERCRNWTVAGEDGLCAAHAGIISFKKGHLINWKHGGYVQRVLPHEMAYYLQERAKIEAGDRSVDLELAAMRSVLGRLVACAHPTLIPLADFFDATQAIFWGTRTIATLLSVQQALTSDQDRVLYEITMEMLAAGTLEEDEDGDEAAA
jgi:hypothetical protein